MLKTQTSFNQSVMLYRETIARYKTQTFSYLAQKFYFTVEVSRIGRYR